MHSRTSHPNANNNSATTNRRNHAIAQDRQAAPQEELRSTLSIVIESNQIAFALYDEFQNEILMESVQVLSNEHLEQKVSAFMRLTNANFLLVSSRLASNAPLLDMIRSCSSLSFLEDSSSRNLNGNRTATGSYNKIPYQINKSKAYDLNHCKMIILQKLRVLTLFKNLAISTSSSSRQPSTQTISKHTLRKPTTYHSLASIVDFESPIVLKALGSLLSHMQSTTHRLEEGSTVTVNSIRYVHSSSYMKIDPVTLQSLHIFATDHHPLQQKKGHDKEGFSLFNLLDRTKSAWGRKCLREWMRNPLLNVEEIRKRQDGVELFLESNMKDVRNRLVNVLCKIGPVDKILSRMGKCTSVPMDFIILSKTLASFVSIFKILNIEVQNKILENLNSCIDHGQRASMETTARHHLNFIQELLEKCHVSNLQDLFERIASIVDHEATIETKDCVVIHHGFHEELDRAKEAFDMLDTTLSMIGSQILQKHPELSTVKVIFLPQVGFLVALDKRNHHNSNSNDFPDLPPDFSFVFEQGNEAFFKNHDMRRLDDDIGDLDAFIKDTESMIVSELEEDILDCESELRISFGAMAELDCILSFASCAADLNYVRPKVVDSVESDCIVVENGRHPLQELLLDGNFIPNDTYLDSTNRVNIITGPNFSGKSCYMRQVGILVYMSHIGSFVPCDKALIPVIDQILARINNIETCAVPQSSYQLDLTQMATILNRSTSKSLVLVDEFGKGTSPLSGISVLTAALKKLSKIQCKIICTTHFLEIFSLGLLRDGHEGVRLLQMAVHVPESDEDDAVPLFKLEEGLAKSSAGLLCAKLAGVHDDVISRANEILGALKNGNQVKPISSNLNYNSVFQPASKAAIRHFLSIESWKDQPNHEITALREKIALM